MKHISTILKNFSTLKEYTEFLEELVEAEGSEISRGKDPNDKSKEEKETESEEDEAEAPPAEGGEGEEAAAEEPVVDPVAAPGSQVAIGKKEPNDADDPKAVEIKLSGKQEKIDMKPRHVVDANKVQ